jgi:hypothetical protein
MLFNLTTRSLFKCHDPTNAITCHSQFLLIRNGPIFGSSELKAFEPFNGFENCKSYTKRPCYRIRESFDRKNMLTNLENIQQDFVGFFCEFTLSELEVWEVIFEK